ncbi:hypothetical protein GCM10009792_23810 [Microcella alkalica]
MITSITAPIAPSVTAAEDTGRAPVGDGSRIAAGGVGIQRLNRVPPTFLTLVERARFDHYTPSDLAFREVRQTPHTAEFIGVDSTAPQSVNGE